MNTYQINKKESLQSEAVLVLQGGGSLGAYECGVYKKLYEHGIKFDILAGSSIGAINASIICSAQNANKDAAQVLIFGSQFQKISNLQHYYHYYRHSYLYPPLHRNYRLIK